jgi:N-acetylneuraminate synthase
MHCVSSYPTSPSDTNIDVINSIKNLSKKYKNIIPGYSSHDLTYDASSMAIACGARILEKHIKIDSKKWAHFDETALNINYEFPLWVRHMRSAENILGSQNKKIYRSEHHKYHFKKN